jgi:hypothetical protein
VACEKYDDSPFTTLALSINRVDFVLQALVKKDTIAGLAKSVTVRVGARPSPAMAARC